MSFQIHLTTLFSISYMFLLWTLILIVWLNDLHLSFMTLLLRETPNKNSFFFKKKANDLSNLNRSTSGADHLEKKTD